MNELAKELSKNIVNNDPEIDQRVARGIEENRKGFGEIELVGKDGQPVKGAHIELKHVRHEFHFGCNSFMVGQFKEQERNAVHDEAFSKLFNLAVIPFYWRDSEPQDGALRFDKDSPFIYRRPPADLVLEFCQKYDITPKGHPLCWHHILPKWAPLEKAALAARLERRIREIAARYGDRIKIWDVCNEAICWNPFKVEERMPDGHVELAFKIAAHYLPPTSTLTYNDYACWDWLHGDYTPFYMLGRHLKGSNVNLGGLGLQYHMFGRPGKEMLAQTQTQLNARHILACLDQYAKIGVPLNISELTLTAHKDLGDGQAFQCEMADRLYRLWFSHPATNGIIWWNLIDDTAYVNPDNSSQEENQYKGGLLNNDLTPKPAYNALCRLIREEWSTHATLEYEKGGYNRFNGFYGEYVAVIKTSMGEFRKTLKLSKGSINKFKLTLE
ncbi:MAG: hypothetical protein A2X45_23050 [Lentisphaerae bacterium GWF2_50_93]|nr:MAG: hypothetical protein A2X45_23050 [Lentisphaerae bacterium GWF2_50_93]